MDALNARAGRALAKMTVFMAIALFVPAGTLRYWQAWAYLAVFVGASTIITVDLMRRDRPLLARRLEAGPSAETDPTHQRILRLGAFGFAALLALPGLERHLGDPCIPFTGIVVGSALVILGFVIVARVYRENTFTAATVGVVPGQTVISTGPYAIVRHPMYLGAALCLLGTPFALASCWALAPMTALIALIVWRLLDEERFLTAHLPGYAEYRQRVRRRLVPWIW